MTRWYLTNLPVRVGSEHRPRWDVDRVYFDWQRGMLDVMVLHGGWSWPLLPFGPGVEIRDREVWIADPTLVVRSAKDKLKRARGEDWDDRPCTDARGHTIGRVRDVEFQEDTGEVRAVWISRGVLADVWHGMWLADFHHLQRVDDRIALV